MIDISNFRIGSLSGEKLLKAVCIYFAAVSLWAIFLAVYDKIASKKLPNYRIRESTLIFVSVIGGAAAMLVAMLTVRHKTSHVKFMVGVPLILLAQVVLIWALLHFGVITF